MLADRFRLLILYFPAFLFALACHEASHGLVAYRFGDSTAKDAGRLTLNPLPHMDFFGTLVLPLATWFAPGALPIGGWGKPVPVDYRRLQNPRRDGLWIALAGPASNFVLALAFAAVLRTLLWLLPQLVGMSFAYDSMYLTVMDGLVQLAEVSVWINLGLALFNLLPVHPLDGGKVLAGILPLRWAVFYDRFSRYGVFVLIALFYAGGFRYLQIPIRELAKILIPS